MNCPNKDVQIDHYLTAFRQSLAEATKEIDKQYFLLPVASPNGPSPNVRERVYAYELYHQLRVKWPPTPGFPYSLNGEVDKRKSWLYEKSELRNSIPDLLVHHPGDPTRNLVVIEIKALYGKRRDVKADLKKLSAFRNDSAKYSAAILLVFGDDIEQAKRAGRTVDNDIKLDDIELYHHSSPGKPASPVSWRS